MGEDPYVLFFAPIDLPVNSPKDILRTKLISSYSLLKRKQALASLERQFVVFNSILLQKHQIAQKKKTIDKTEISKNSDFFK